MSDRELDLLWAGNVLYEILDGYCRYIEDGPMHEDAEDALARWKRLQNNESPTEAGPSRSAAS